MNDDEGQPLIAETARETVLQKFFPALFRNLPQEGGGQRPEGVSQRTPSAPPAPRCKDIMPDVILSVLAHPDDAEFLCAGTLLRLAREHGWQIHIASMTPGDCGSAELPPDQIAAVRRAEGARAAALAGGHYHCLEERDLRVIYNEAALEKVVRLINQVRPTVVFTHSPDDYHLDH